MYSVESRQNLIFYRSCPRNSHLKFRMHALFLRFEVDDGTGRFVCFAEEPTKYILVSVSTSKSTPKKTHTPSVKILNALRLLYLLISPSGSIMENKSILTIINYWQSLLLSRTNDRSSCHPLAQVNP